MSYKTKKKLKKVLLIAASLLVTVMCVSWVGNLSGGFENMNPADWQLFERNDKNLIAVDDLVEEFDNGSGFTIVRDSNGTFTIDGKNEATDAQVVELGTVTLQPGTYTFTTGKNGKNDAANNYYFHMTLENASGSVSYSADFGGSFEVTQETTYKIKLTIGAEKTFNNRVLYPAIVAGTEAVDFYG